MEHVPTTDNLAKNNNEPTILSNGVGEPNNKPHWAFVQAGTARTFYDRVKLPTTDADGKPLVGQCVLAWFWFKKNSSLN